jgi:8-amino-7-oxononanoate synthase
VRDFTSSLYLGLDHASGDLPGWRSLTLGKPAAFHDPPGSAHVERELAALTGCEAAVLAPSTLHLFVDLFAMLARPGYRILLDRRSYPVARLAARLALCARTDRSATQHPVIVTDGIDCHTGRIAPLRQYARLAAERGGLVVVDDTQALGITGASPTREAPYGTGGGGSLRRQNLTAPNVLLVGSLAKAFGTPVAVLAGSKGTIESFRDRSFTRVHSSPPSAAVIAAAARALAINRLRGDAIRRRLAALVCRFERGARELGLPPNRSLFPVRRLRLPDNVDDRFIHSELAERHIRAALLAGPGGRPAVTFVLTARHSVGDIAKALEALGEALGHRTSQRRPMAYFLPPLSASGAR